MCRRSERRLRKKSARVFEASERKRGCLHIEPAIDSYGEVNDRFGLRLAAEPPYLLTSRLDTFVDPPAELGTSSWALSGGEARPGFVRWTLREIG